MEIEGRKRFLINIAFFVSVGVLWFISMKLLSGALFPFAAALLLTVALQGPIKKITTKLHLKKDITSVFIVILFFSLLVAALFLLGFALYRQLNGILGALPETAGRVSDIIKNLSERVKGFIGRLPDGTGDLVEGLPQAALDSVTKSVADFVTDLAGSLVSGVPVFFLSAAVMIIASAYLAKDYDNIREFFVKNFSKGALSRIIEAKDTVFDNLFKVFKSYFIIMFITFVELLLGLSLLGFKYSLVAALLISIVDILPILGSGTVLIPWAVICALSENVKGAIGLAVLYLVIAAVRNVIEPKVIGSRVGIHPLIMLVSVFLGLRLFGGAGVLLVPMTVIVLKNLPWHPKGQGDNIPAPENK